MASFIENLRGAGGIPALGGIQGGESRDQWPVSPVLKKRWDDANWSGFEKDLDSGKVRGTDKYYENEKNTVMAMDNIYSDLSIKFQDYFYNKYYDPSKGDEEVSDKEILKESAKFIKDQVENTPLKNIEFANGKSFYENFRKYGYDTSLLPDSNGRIYRVTRNGKSYEIPEPRYEKVFPFKVAPQVLQEQNQFPKLS